VTDKTPPAGFTLGPVVFPELRDGVILSKFDARPTEATYDAMTVVPKFYSRPSDVGPDSYAETIKKMYEECELREKEGHSLLDQQWDAALAFSYKKQPLKIAFLDGVVLCFFSAIIGAMLMHWIVQ
jgi:hypothetical protein